jgi:DNA-binding HxlR family transcriptional regulator
MTQGSYKQFCPVAMASEILCTRWTMVLLRELVAGSTRFNDLRRGVPRMSPALLSKRLKDLEEAGIVVKVASQEEVGVFEYRLTRAGRDLKGVVDAVGNWGQAWVEAQLSLKNLDPSLLMWDMRRNLDPTPIPKRRCVIQFLYSELPIARRNWFLLVDPSKDVDLCSVDPGFDVDLYVATDLRTMTEIWLGMSTVAQAVERDRMMLTGDRQLASDMQVWLGLSPFAAGKGRAATHQQLISVNVNNSTEQSALI